MSDRQYNGQGGLPIKRYIGRLYFTEPAPKWCVFARHFLGGWDNTREFQVAEDRSWIRVNAENGTALYRLDQEAVDKDTGLYRLKEASWSAPPPFATPEQLALDW